MNELPIIQKTYDLIEWYIPHLNGMNRDFKFNLGERVIAGLYDLLEGLLRARFAKNKREMLMQLNDGLDILRYQTRLLLSFHLLTPRRYRKTAVKPLASDMGI